MTSCQGGVWGTHTVYLFFFLKYMYSLYHLLITRNAIQIARAAFLLSLVHFVKLYHCNVVAFACLSLSHGFK